MTKGKLLGLTVAAAAALTFASLPATTLAAKGVKCYGVKSENLLKDSKGRMYLVTKSKVSCKKAGGSTSAPKVVKSTKSTTTTTTSPSAESAATPSADTTTGAGATDTTSTTTTTDTTQQQSQ